MSGCKYNFYKKKKNPPEIPFCVELIQFLHTSVLSLCGQYKASPGTTMSPTHTHTHTRRQTDILLVFRYQFFIAKCLHHYLALLTAIFLDPFAHFQSRGNNLLLGHNQCNISEHGLDIKIRDVHTSGVLVNQGKSEWIFKIKTPQKRYRAQHYSVWMQPLVTMSKWPVSLEDTNFFSTYLLLLS